MNEMASRAKVGQLWNWLVAFRAVAESQHLPTASRQLNVSASSLSRTVRLLEDELGRDLFERHGRQLTLSAPGRVLLSAVSEAMIAVERGVEALNTRGFDGPIHISAPGPYAAVFVLPALEQVVGDYPNLVPTVSSTKTEEVTTLVLNGRLDIALVDEPIPHERIQIHRLGELSFGVYCGATHPLAARHTLAVEELADHVFVGPPSGLEDHWPRHLERRIGMVASQMHVGVQACATGKYLAVLPDSVADHYRGNGALCRLPLEVVDPKTLYAVTAQLPEVHNRVEVVLDAIFRRVLQSCRFLSATPPRPSGIFPKAPLRVCSALPPPPRAELSEPGPAVAGCRNK